MKFVNCFNYFQYNLYIFEYFTTKNAENRIKQQHQRTAGVVYSILYAFNVELNVIDFPCQNFEASDENKTFTIVLNNIHNSQCRRQVVTTRNVILHNFRYFTGYTRFKRFFFLYVTNDSGTGFGDTLLQSHHTVRWYYYPSAFEKNDYVTGIAPHR